MRPAPAAAQHGAVKPIRRLLLAVLLLPLLAGAARAADDEPELRRLNDAYLQAALASDAHRLEPLLAEDFTAVLADGSLVSRAEYLRQAALPLPLRDFREDGVTVRVYGDAAVLSAVAIARLQNGGWARSRYTDVYVRRSGAWRIASIQITRITR
ncbi:MAG TPA: nuclear transport factor 2 family protein [Opitutaceae bacterium]|nr:nuclear transport factor 2 family protein [Opitutaceae bacterium]